MAVREESQSTRTWKAIAGGLLVILGIAAFNAAAITSIALIYTLGWVLIIGGIVGFVLSFAIRGAGGIVLGIVSSILSLVVGALMITNPGVSLATLTLLLAMFFIVDGVIRVAMSFTPEVENKGWSIVYGIILFLIGAAIWAHLPYSSLYIFGLFIGIELILRGAAILASSVTPVHVGTHRPRFA